MTPSKDLIATRIATLPLSSAERAQALAYVAAGEDFAEALIAFARFSQMPQALKPSH